VVAELSAPAPYRRGWLIGLTVFYAIVVTFIGVHSGGDLVDKLRETERLFHGERIYAGVDASRGLPWMPFANFALIPFALLARFSLPLTKAIWAVGNAALFGWCVDRGRQWGGRWLPAVLAVAAVAQPLQSNFQYLNINVVLLGLLVVAIGEARRGRDARAAVAIAVAAALKGYPAGVFLYFACRRRWGALALGIAVAALLTVGGMLPFGRAGLANLGDYAALAWHGQSTSGLTGQPIGGLVARLGGSPALALLFDGLATLMVAVTLITRPSADPLYDLGFVAVLAVLLAPLDRLHFYVVLFPAWVAVLRERGPEPAAASYGRAAALLAAGLLTSGMLTFPGIMPPALFVIWRNNYIWGALLLLVLATLQRTPLLRPAEAPA